MQQASERREGKRKHEKAGASKGSARKQKKTTASKSKQSKVNVRQLEFKFKISSAWMELISNWNPSRATASKRKQEKARESKRKQENKRKQEKARESKSDEIEYTFRWSCFWNPEAPCKSKLKKIGFRRGGSPEHHVNTV